MEICDDRRHAAEMIGMRVRDHDGVDVVDAAIPQIGRNNLLADVKIGVHPERQASRVHQENTSSGRDEQDRIALADIDRSHLQDPGVEVWPRRNKRNPGSHARKPRDCAQGSHAPAPYRDHCQRQCSHRDYDQSE